MAFKIFYAWQSDSNVSLCKDLIHDALDKAAVELTREFGIDIAIDQDTQDVPGSPSIPDTILQMIAESESVVADLTLTHTSDRQETKRGSNPNVMLEYGYALRAGDRNIIGVINTAFGAVEELSFDLRHKRHITYRAAMDADENERTQPRDNLAKEFTKAFRPIVRAAAGPDATEEANRARSRKRRSATAGTPPKVPQQPAADRDDLSGNRQLDEIIIGIDREAKSKKKDGENWTARFSNGRIRLNLRIANLSVTREIDPDSRR